MKAITFAAPGDAQVLRLADVEPPSFPEGLPQGVDHGAMRIAVRATAVNRADIMQRRGLYPPPPGASPILGLECAGTVREVGAGPWKVGQRVMALLTGGGYAEEVVVDAGSVMAVPDCLSDDEAAAFPEATLTAFLNIFLIGEPPEGGAVLIHGGGSGVGTAAIRLCKEAGIKTFVTAGSPDKCQRCLDHGATVAIPYRDKNFAEVVREHTGGHGVNVVLDCIGGPYLDDNLQSLAQDGRLVNIGLMGGPSANLNMRLLLSKRLQVIGSTLRGRSNAAKAKLVQALHQRFGAALAAGRLRPIIDRVYPLVEAAAAHARMESSEHFGKIVLRVGG